MATTDWKTVIKDLFDPHWLLDAVASIEVVNDLVKVFFKTDPEDPRMMISDRVWAAGRNWWGQQPAPFYYHGTDVSSAIGLAAQGFKPHRHSPVGLYTYSDMNLVRQSQYNQGAICAFKSFGIVISESKTRALGPDHMPPGLIGRSDAIAF